MSYHQISFIEMRILGCLIEKEITTPDQYPLSLNALINACNQKSNREPVTRYSELDVQDAVDGLVARGLMTEVSAAHSRVSKYQHRFCNTEFSDLQLSPAETAVVCLLFLRGAQTPGELRSRSGRLHAFQSREEVEQALSSLQEMTGGPYVCQLPREPGKREQRYQECFCIEHDIPQQAATAQTFDADVEYTEQLEQRVLVLEETVKNLIERIQRLESPSGL
ncbi:YceH family protein [Marinomonas transparens]|uniref:YceH family protein n=1 Tax=Marinomonas transparens TaxID=2795388 RepID=A0A934JR71_9GAMM|nr:YceH family protein [Marinomonas transparens]MBJ7538323.1 YceH family protein [Marinomonas transparens]